MTTGNKDAHEAFDAMMQASQAEWERIGYEKCLDDLRKFLALHDPLTEQIDSWARMVRSDFPPYREKLQNSFWVSDDDVHDNDTIHIDDMNLQPLTHGCLKREGIRTIGDILKRDIDSIGRFRNFGKSSFCDLYKAMAAYGYHPAVKED